MTTEPVALTYFDIRGRAECIRLLMEECGLVYEDRQITNDEWTALKPRTPFGQVPILRIGGEEIVQTMAILQHLARVHGLAGASEVERTRRDITIEAIRDADHQLGSLVWSPGFEEKRDAIVEKKLPKHLVPLERFFVSNPTGGPFWAGPSLTSADIFAFDYLETAEALFPGALQATERLAEFHQRMTERPNIKAYFESGRRPDAIMYGPPRRDERDYSDPGPMNDALRKIYPAADPRSME